MNEQIQVPKGAPLFNPWTPEFIADPYPFYHRLRTADPVHATSLGFYVVSRHADVTTVLRDKRFGKDFVGRMMRRHGPQILDEPVYRSMRHWMLQLDPPDHGRLRSLVVRAFLLVASRTCARASSRSSRPSQRWLRRSCGNFFFARFIHELAFFVRHRDSLQRSMASVH